MRRLLLLAVLLAFVALAPTGAALYEDVTFVDVAVDDTPDHAGFHDIVKISVGEPGDGTLVGRYEVALFAASAPVSSLYWFFNVGETQLTPGFTADGTPDTFVSATAGAGADATPESCTVVDNVVFCVISMAKIGVSVGTTLTANHGISYAGAAQDWAPAPGGFVVGNTAQMFGADYTLTGCTRADACEGGVDLGPMTHYSDLAEARVLASHAEATDDTYVYNLTSDLSAGVIAFNVNVTQGSVLVQMVDDAGAPVYEATFLESGEGLAEFEQAQAGAWQITVEYSSFVGSVDLGIGEAEDDETTDGGSGSGSGGSGSGSGGSGGGSGGDDSSTGAVTDDEEDTTGGESEEKKDTPSPGFVVVIALLGIALFARRR